MEEQILAVDLSTEQTLEVNLPEQDNVAQIDVYWQDEVVLDLDASLMYIVSGQQEIQDYVDNKSKPEIDDYIETYAKPIVAEVVEQEAAPIIDEYFEGTVKPSITAFANTEMAGYAQTAKEQVDLAAEQADRAEATANTVSQTVEEFNTQTEATKNEFIAFVNDKTVQLEEVASNAATEATDGAEHSRIWAEGEQAEVKELGGELSSMGAADLAYAIANAPEDTPIDASGLFAMNVVKGEKGDKGEDGKDGAGVELGDIGFAPFGIDESKNLRRYLNGQVISQSQFESFAKLVKERIALYPNLSATEENWQAEVTNSPYGICGKFVVDDTLGTIRLPKYPDWSIREVGQASVIGNGTLGFTDGTNIISQKASSNYSIQYAEYHNAVGTQTSGGTINQGVTLGITTNPTKSGIIADLVNANTEDKLQGKWFIQVATGVEESVDVTREIELNNPFSLLDYKWSEYELNNASWLLSNGAFHSGATYVAVYELLLKIKNGTEIKDGVSVKLSTEAYTDTDFVLNTDDTTFRLPIKVKLASGSAVVGNGMTLGLTDGTNFAGIRGNSSSGEIIANQPYYGVSVGQTATASGNLLKQAVGVVTDSTKSGIETSSSGLKLYFYVGETIQDANVINASGVLTRVAELSNEYIVGLGMPDYNSGVSVTLPYTANNKCFVVAYASAQNKSITFSINGVFVSTNGGTNALYYFRDGFYLDVGDVLSCDVSSTGNMYPLKGVN